MLPEDIRQPKKNMSRESLLNLDTLTEEERNIILSVLRKDDELKKTQDRKIGQLKLEIQAIRMKSVLRNGDDLTKICARCHAELGFLFNRGDICPKCHFKVCRACQEVVLDGTWLCILCHKQRQLKFFMEEWNRGKLTNTKRTGTELVKASMIKQRRPGRVNDEHNQPDKTRGVQNGNPVHNGSAFRNKKEAESERIEYPNDSDRRKLTQLFDAFKLNKSNEKPEQTESKTQVSVKKLSTRRYDDSDDDSSSSDDDRPSRDTLSNVPQRIKDSHSAENVSLVEHVPRGVLQRNYSDDSDQTAMSDETPFLKSTGSTETQIRVEIHSDSSGTPQKNKPPISDQSSDKIKHSRSNYANDGIVRAESMSSYRSTSPEIIDTPSLQRQAYSHNRSPSPYSFDSIPSSHADSPLPKKKLSELQRKDSDADSRISGISGYSGMSGAAEHSGTESVVKDSGEEEYVVEEVTNIKFRRVSRKHKGSSSSSPVDDIEAHQGGSSGKGRVDYVDIPKALIKVSEISVSDIEKDIDSENEGYVNLDLISMATSPTHGKGLIGAGGKLKKTDSPKQSKKSKMEPKSEKSTQNQKSNIGSKSKKETVDSVEVVNKKAKTANRLNKMLLSDNKSERQSPKTVDKARLSSKSEMELEQKETTIYAKELLNQLLTGKSDIQTNMSSTGAIDLSDTRAVVPKSDNKTGYVPVGSKQSTNVQPKHEKMKSKESKTSLDINRETDYDASFEDIVSDVQKSGSKSEGGTKSVPGKDSEFDELFNIAMADLSVEESTDMSDTGSISRAKGKKLKHLKRKKKTEKTDEQEKIKQPSSGAELKQTDAEPMKENQHTDHEVLEKRNAHLQKTEDAIIVTEEEISPIRVIKKEEQISPLRVIKKEEKISPAHLIKQEEVTEEEISPVRIIKEEVTLFSVDKLEEIATSYKHDLNESETKEMDKKRKDASKSNDEHSTAGKTAQSATENLQGTSLETEPHSQHRDDIKLESLSLHEIMELMRNNVLPMDEELLRLIEEQFAQNRDIVLPSLITNGGSDSDELSIIHEESEPSESDTSLENKSLQESKPLVIGDIPEVKVEDYEEMLSTLQLSSGREVIPANSKENNVTNMEVSDITIIVKDNQNSKKVENTEIHQIYDIEQSHISADLTDEIEVKARENDSSCSETNNTQSNTQELEQFYKDIKQKVALEYYMETQKKSSTSPVNDGITDNMKEDILTKDPDNTNTKESLNDVSGLGQQSDDALRNVKTQLFQENRPETDIYNLSNECLQSIDIENSQTIELRKKIIPDVDINYEKDIRSETSVDKFTETPSDSEQSQISPRSVVVSQFTRPSSVTLEVDESDSESYIAITSNESGSPVKIVSELKIEVPSSPVQDKENIILNEVDEGSDPTKTPCRKEGYQKFGTPFPGGHTPSRDENSADITLTPTNKSGDSEGTFCASFVADSASDKEVKDIISRKSKEKSDIVGQSLSREVLVKQWLSSKTEIRDDSSSPQSDLSETASINPALQPESPACGLSSQEIPKLNMQDWKESEGEIATKLSPRASSEGSASFEDSGHVSGASTQENTPEHRRTDSLQSQTSMGSSKLSTVTDKESEDDPDIDEIVRSHKSLQSSLGSSRGNLLSAMTESRESLVSYYSNAGDIDYGKIPVTGDIQFGLDYNYRTGTLEIHICQCKGLAPADTRRNRSDPYVKTYLLPDKTRSGKRKTKIKKHTLNPTFDEKLRYLISKSELENRTVWVTVWHNDRFGRNDFLGEVTINFDYYRFGDSAPKWYKLQERFEQPTSMLTYKGDIILCLKYVPPEKVNRDSTSPSPTRKKIKKPKMPGDKGQLHVLIREARNLTAVRSNGYSDPFCKGQLQPDKDKQKTHVIKKECNPAWNHTMVFDDVTVDSLKEKSLELTIWDYDKLSSNDFLGGVRLNLGIGRSFGKIVDWMDARGEEISLWQAMLDRPNFWIDGALVLRPTMNKRR